MVDPLTVKVRKIYKDVTEEDLYEIMKKYGEVTRCKIPTNEVGEYKGLAFVTYKRAEDCTKVIEAGYVQYEFSELPCDRAMMSNKKAMEMKERAERFRDRPRREDGDYRGEGGYRRDGEYKRREGGDNYYQGRERLE